MTTRKADIVIAGAGPSGICAALEAARSGAKVILLERYGSVGGNLTNGHVGPLLGRIGKGTMTSEIQHLIVDDKVNVCHDFEKTKILLTGLLEEAGVEVYLQTTVVDAEAAAGQVKRVIGNFRGEKMAFEAPVFIDATGDGDLAVLCGCESEIGREEDGLVQPVTLMFIISGVDPENTLTCRHEEHTTMLSNGKEYLQLCHDACASGELPPTVNIVRLYLTQYPDERMVNATQKNFVNPLKAEDMFEAEADLRRQMMQIVDFLKNNVPGYENIRIKSASSTLGVRESRRIMGDYVMQGDDCRFGTRFEDVIVHDAEFEIDIHNPSGPGQAVSETGCPDRSLPYDIPYRAFCPRGMDNLLVTGRCISGTHEALASYRVMNIAMAMGQACGAAAYLMNRENCTSRELDVKLIQQHLEARGVELR